MRKELLYRDIYNDIQRMGLKKFINIGLTLSQYATITDGIDAVYSNSLFYNWLVLNEYYSQAAFIKKEVEMLANEYNLILVNPTITNLKVLV